MFQEKLDILANQKAVFQMYANEEARSVTCEMSALSSLSFVSLSAASRPHPSPATRNKTLTWFIDDTTRKGGIHLEQDDFHRDVIFMNQRRLMMMFRDSWMMVVGSLDILTWHLEMLRISGEGLEELEERRMEIMGQYFMPGLRTNINPGCHCKNKQGHCLHFIAIFLRLQFSWHTIELWIKRTFSLLKFPDSESVMLFISKLKCMHHQFNGGSAEHKIGPFETTPTLC